MMMLCWRRCKTERWRGRLPHREVAGDAMVLGDDADNIEEVELSTMTETSTTASGSEVT
jgi:hypothetical protein